MSDQPVAASDSPARVTVKVRAKIALARIKRRVIDVARGILKGRSKHWPTVRERHLRRNPSCAACGSIAFPEVHHKKPFYVSPELELADGTGAYGSPVGVCNLITLCDPPGPEGCHFKIGHLGTSWKDWNHNIDKDVKALFKAAKLKAQASIASSVSQGKSPSAT